MVMVENPEGKIIKYASWTSLFKMWRRGYRSDESLNPGPDWQARRDIWKIGWSQWLVTPRNNKLEENSLNIIHSREMQCFL